LKVIYVSHLHPPPDARSQNIGGMQTTSMQLLEAFKQRSDLSVYPILLESPWKGIELRTFWFLLKLFFTLPSLVKREKADAILFSSMVTASLSLFVRHRIKVPMVTVNHGQDVTLSGGGYQRVVPKIFQNLQGVISISAATRQASIERGLSPDRSTIIPNGFETIADRRYDKQAARQWIEQNFHLDLSDKYLLLSVGRQVKRKGHAWFVEEVLPKIEQDVVYLLIGQGKEHSRLHALKQQSSAGDRIILAGAQPTEVLRQAYDAADLFIMPNIPIAGDLEGFGVVMLEANEARTPVIGSDLEGLKDVIGNGINGYRVPAYNSDRFAETIDETLQWKLEYLSESAYEFVMAQYTWEHICDRYAQFLRAIATKHKPKFTGFYSNSKVSIPRVIGNR
jgi:phosphatidyl-myo-inositol dimannoside synthase